MKKRNANAIANAATEIKRASSLGQIRLAFSKPRARRFEKLARGIAREHGLLASVARGVLLTAALNHLIGDAK